MKFASVRAAALAAELGVEAERIEGTGRAGSVTVTDVRAAAAGDTFRSLGDAGRALRAAVTAAVPVGCELDERDDVLLLLAAGQADDLARLEEVVEREGATATGSTGQLVVHPALSEARQARLAIGRLLGLLDLTDALGSRGTEASRRGRRAAQARWRERGARGSEGSA